MLFIHSSPLSPMRVRLVRQIGAPRAAGVARRAVLVVAVLLAVVASVLGLVQGLVGADGHELLAGLVVEVALGAEAAALAAAVVGRAAADGEHPEEAGGDGEGGADPHGREELCVEVGLDAVPLGGALHGADHHDGHGGGHGGGGADGHGGYAGDDEGDARDGAAAVGKDAEEDLDGEGDVGNDENDLGPLRDGGKRVHRLGHLIGEGDVLAGGGSESLEGAGGCVQSVGGPVELGLCARSIAGGSSIAVTPETNIVEVVETQVGGGYVRCL